MLLLATMAALGGKVYKKEKVDKERLGEGNRLMAK